MPVKACGTSGDAVFDRPLLQIVRKLPRSQLETLEPSQHARPGNALSVESSGKAVGGARERCAQAGVRHLWSHARAKSIFAFLAMHQAEFVRRVDSRRTPVFGDEDLVWAVISGTDRSGFPHQAERPDSAIALPAGLGYLTGLVAPRSDERGHVDKVFRDRDRTILGRFLRPENARWARRHLAGHGAA